MNFFTKVCLSFLSPSQKKYEPERAKLTTYLYPRLKGAMYRWMECNLGVLFFDPGDMAELWKAQQLYYDTGKEPEEIAKELGISVEDVARHIGYKHTFFRSMTLCLTRTESRMIRMSV